jgi:hypothetical protein
MRLRMPEKRLTVVMPLLLVSLAVAGALASAATSGQEDGMGQIYGSWAWSTHIGSGTALPSLATIDKDGTVHGVDSMMFANPLGAPGKMSPFHGAWERTGPASIGGTSIWMRFDDAGMLKGFGRVRSALALGPDRNHLQGTMFLETLDCTTPFSCPDPTDDSNTWTPYGPGFFPVTATRILRVPPPAPPGGGD